MTSFSTVPLLTHPVPAMQASLLLLVMLIVPLPGGLRMWTWPLTGMLSGDTCWGPWPCFLQVSVQERPSLFKRGHLCPSNPKSPFLPALLYCSPRVTMGHVMYLLIIHFSPEESCRRQSSAELCSPLCRQCRVCNRCVINSYWVNEWSHRRKRTDRCLLEVHVFNFF